MFGAVGKQLHFPHPAGCLGWEPCQGKHPEAAVSPGFLLGVSSAYSA